MPKDKLSYLGNCIRQARNDCNLTQQDLADQSHVAIKTIQMIEKGKINPSYEILYPLIKRLGISPNTLFNPEISDTDEEIQRFIGKFQACIPENRKQNPSFRWRNEDIVRKPEKLPDFFICRNISNYYRRYLKYRKLFRLKPFKKRKSPGY